MYNTDKPAFATHFFSFMLSDCLFSHQIAVNAHLSCTVPDIYGEQPLCLCLHSSNGFHLSGFTVVKGKIKNAQRETRSEKERENIL